MFWISAGNTWCSKYRPLALERRIRTGAHSPGPFRLTIFLVGCQGVKGCCAIYSGSFSLFPYLCEIYSVYPGWKARSQTAPTSPETSNVRSAQPWTQAASAKSGDPRRRFTSESHDFPINRDSLLKTQSISNICWSAASTKMIHRHWLALQTSFRILLREESGVKKWMWIMFQEKDKIGWEI